MELAQIVQGCLEGNPSAVEALVRVYEKDLYRLALSILDDPSEAEEATQDAFLAALKALASYRGEATLGTWLYRITINICQTRLRRRMAWERLKDSLQAVFRLVGVGPGESHAPPEAAVIQNEADAAIWRAVQALGEKHRLVVILYYYHDLPVTEIAQTLGIQEGTVYSRLYTAHERLRVLLAEPPSDSFPWVEKASDEEPDQSHNHPHERPVHG
jgi:RNA polymerase sigma-70 factor, ECF subfamily